MFQPHTNTSQQINTIRVDELNEEAFRIRNSDTKRALELCKTAQDLSAQLGYETGKASALSTEGFCYIQLTEYERGHEKLFGALEIFEHLNQQPGIAQVHYNLGVLYFRLGNYSNALDSVNKAFDFYKKENNHAELARCYFQLGLLHLFLMDYESAVEYNNQAVQMALQHGLPAVEAAAKMLLGQTYMALKQYERSGEYLQESLNIRERIKDERGYCAALNAQMNLCLETNRFDEAEQISKKGITLAERLGDKMSISRFMVDLAKISFSKNNLVLAEQKGLEALQIAEHINLRMALVPVHQLLSEIYEKTGDHKKALQHYKSFFKINSEINDTNAAMKAKSIQYLNKIENARKEAEIHYLKNVELKRAFEEIEGKNREITASITYALRIQTAILPAQKLIDELLPKSFVLYKPKDIVAGDFYWLDSLGGDVLFAACDCTGHGVPGAMVSVVCHNALNRAVREFGLHQPAAILDKTTEIVVEHFTKNEVDIKDGMDISLCCLNSKTKTLQWAGANNPLWLIRNGELLETKANKQPVGAQENRTKFTNHQFELNAGDRIYIFSDGYADQFGGSTGQKKLTKKGFRDLLLSIQKTGIKHQGQALNEFHKEYKQQVEQVDDILVIGIQVE